MVILDQAVHISGADSASRTFVERQFPVFFGRVCLRLGIEDRPAIQRRLLTTRLLTLDRAFWAMDYDGAVTELRGEVVL